MEKYHTYKKILKKFLVQELDNPETLKSIQEAIDNLYKPQE